MRIRGQWILIHSCVELQWHRVTKDAQQIGVCCTMELERWSIFRCQLGELMHKCSHCLEDHVAQKLEHSHWLQIDLK